MCIGIGIGSASLHDVLAQRKPSQLQHDIPGAAGVKARRSAIESGGEVITPHPDERRGKTGAFFHGEHDGRMIAPVPRHIQCAVGYSEVVKPKRGVGVELAVILLHALLHGQTSAVEGQLLRDDATAAHDSIRDLKGAHAIDGFRVNRRSLPRHGKIPLLFGRIVGRKIDPAVSNIQRAAADGDIANGSGIEDIFSNRKPVIAARHGAGFNLAAGLDQISVGYLDPGADIRKDLGAV